MHGAYAKCRAAEDLVLGKSDHIRCTSENLGKEEQEEQVDYASLENYHYFGEDEEALVGHGVDFEAAVEVSMATAEVRRVECLVWQNYWIASTATKGLYWTAVVVSFALVY